MATDNKKALAFSILEFLQKSCNDGTVNSDDKEGVEVAIQCIGEAFGVDVTDPAQKEVYDTKPANLLTIFDVFLKTKSKKTQSTASSENTSTQETHVPLAAVKEVSEEDKARAEELKGEGNKKVASREYDEAIKLYTEAIEINGNVAVYYANRAAAYGQKKEHQLAVDDARKAILVDPKYSKAYSRLGHALFSLEQYQDAVEAYEEGLKLDPNNSNLKESLRAAQSKIDNSSVESRGLNSESNPGAAPGGMPDLGALLNNPALMNMAQQFMSNPDAMGQLGQMMGGEGGGPNLAEMMRNPELMNMARQFMGGNNGPA